MASSSSAIPRFLLPRSGRIWQRAHLGIHNYNHRHLPNPDLRIVRYASASSKGAKAQDKPIVLEQPARFNPPSHGARLPRKDRPQQQHYGGSLSSEELSSQRKKEYPGLMAPQGTWAHWFWNSQGLHLSITLGTLAGLAIFVATENFKSNTPFADMLPASSDYWEHPIISMRTLFDVWRLTQLHNSAVVAEKRKKNVDDVVKRSEYRKAHGLEKEGAFGNWTARDDTQSPQAEPGKREKWLGIF
ncbi:hypothetical protein diail_7596 [Diaporthe ilicicola]|nr:hypothetical protein diail_7596 [Diaporthe ilicicola]